MVFHTAPPQPASKALWTCRAEFVGGAEASQNGFGDLMPAKLIFKSAMRSSSPEEDKSPPRLDADAPY